MMYDINEIESCIRKITHIYWLMMLARASQSGPTIQKSVVTYKECKHNIRTNIIRRLDSIFSYEVFAKAGTIVGSEFGLINTMMQGNDQSL